MDKPPIDISNSKNGIAIEDALSILSSRKPNQHPDCTSVSESAKYMGQTIDLFGKLSTDRGQGQDKPKLEKTWTDDKESHKRLQNELNDMSKRELLLAVLKVQEDRAKAYKDYETYVPVS